MKESSYSKSQFKTGDVICYSFRLFALLLLTLCTTTIFAQQKSIKGQVVDATGEPLIGVNISAQGTTIGTITDVDGNYTLDVPSNATLVFSYIGYKMAQVPIGNQLVINQILSEDTQNIDEVVVVGYGTQKKVNLTGAVGTVKVGEAMKARPVSNVQELLAGTVPGLNISKGSGAVGVGASLNIRGNSTIGGSSGVLVLIDGIPGNLYTINPNDIESVSVLKDAASASIYGSRAANGVLLVTTKAGVRSEKPIVEFSTMAGFQNPQFKIDFVGSEDYMKLYDLALMNDGKDPLFGEQGVIDLKAGKYADNKWYEEIYKKNTFVNNNHISISGQTKFLSYRLSLSNDNQEGSLPNNYYNRYIIKPFMEFQISKSLKATANIQYTITGVTEPNGGTEWAQIGAARVSPITFIRENNGLYGVGSSMTGNPIAGVNEGGVTQKRYNELHSIFALTYTPVKDWNIRGQYSYYNNQSTYKSRSKTYYLYDANGEIANTGNKVTNVNNTTEYSRRSTLQFTTDYKFSINDAHNLSFLAGYSQEEFYTDNFWASRDNLPFDGIDVIDTGSENRQNGGWADHTAIMSAFGRVNYDYKGLYLFEASVRADGSSRFAPGNRWGVFPSFSAGWNIQREKFMEDVAWLSELKLRASYGTLGDAEKVGFYPTARTLKWDPKIYPFNNVLIGGAWNDKAVNENITWETSTMINAGVDFAIFSNKLRVSLDYFLNVRSDILYTPPVPREYGLGAPISNALKMQNQGGEFAVSYNDSKGDFRWGVSATTSFNINKVLDMAGDTKWIQGNSITYLNDRYQLIYGYESEGLFQNEEDIKSHASQLNPMPGNIKFKDQDGNGKIDGDDRVILKRNIPVNYGLNFNFGWKGFDISVNTYGTLNTFRYINGYEGWAFFLTQNARPMHLDSWTPDNPNASYPRLSLSNTSNDTQFSDYWLRKSDYWKIQNAQIGYTIPSHLLSKAQIESLRIYLTGQNLATITGYEGFDPEGGYYPLPTTFALGVNIRF